MPLNNFFFKLLTVFNFVESGAPVGRCQAANTVARRGNLFGR